ncbi:hypothetical protein EG329_008295 [Mollisiaceae sp. DMI_Dod_QoI]|nr:hypothetical protein EG329_008295 [Helotiales sp. DMI_Dod_QoI]
MPAPSLNDSCIRACIKNIRSLNDVGSFEYWKIKPVLARIASPEQLHIIEQNSPQILGEDAELWQAFIARDIPNWQTKGYVPKNPLKWYEVYCKYKKEQRKEIERDEEALKQSMMGLQKIRQSHVSKVVDLRTLPKVPRDPYMLPNNGGVPLNKNKWGKKEGSGALTWTGGSKTKITDGKSVLIRARREAKEISAMSKLNRPTHQLSGRIGQVKRAPAGMSKEYQIASQPALKILSHKHVLPKNESGIRGPTLEEREARLRAAMFGGTKRYASGDVKETLVGSSDEDFDDEEEEDGDDLFDEPEEKIKPISRPMAGSRLPPRKNHNGPVSSSPPRPKQASSPLSSSRPGRKPSELIGSAISRPRQQASSPALDATSTASSRTMSPGPGATKPTIARKRPEVDVFNRGAKKPKLR